MTDEMIIVKKEPVDDDTDYDEMKENGQPVAETEVSTDMLTSLPPNTASPFDSRNFTCLLCDVMYDNREELRKHLKTVHASKHNFAMNNSVFTNNESAEGDVRSLPSNVNYRYTCTICGAKFKTFRSYISHNVSHRTSPHALARTDDNSRMAVLFGTGKYLQDYIDSDDGYTDTFTCGECNSVFLQRDAYAMHMMMKAMNETCQPVIMTSQSLETSVDGKSASSIDEHEEMLEKAETNEKCNASPTSQGKYSNTHQSNAQRCLEDVTASVDQDEYLKSVLDKVFVRNDMKPEQYEAHARQTVLSSDDKKICTFCGNGFVDQDSLAMHVMSDHSEQMTLPGRRKSSRASKGNEYTRNAHSHLSLNDLKCKFCGQTFFSRDNLAMHLLTHTQLDARDAEVGGQTTSLFHAMKRRHEFDTSLSSVHADRLKLLRMRAIKRFNQLAAKHGQVTSDIKSTQNNDSMNLYCATCKIHFRTKSDMYWHSCNSTCSTVNNDEPLCLAKSSENKPASEEVDRASPEEANDLVTRTRRNSFTANSNALDVHPKRPLSVGDCPTSKDAVCKTDGKPSKQSGTSPRRLNDTVKSSKEMNISAIVPSVNALSSHEQRIIYSVFGKDLGLNKLHSTSVTSSASFERDNVKKPRKDKVHHSVPAVQTSPSDLSLPRSRSRPSSASSTANGTQDECPRSASESKENTMCKYCDIIFLNKAIYYLHMGLHNVNNPWQCNVCGHVCKDSVDFAAHVIHM